MKAEKTVMWLTIYLIVYIALVQLEVSPVLPGLMLLLSPVLLILAVYLVLKDDSVPYPELKEGEEWGYRDKDKAELRLF